MNTITIAGNAVVSSVILLSLCYLAFWRYRTYQVDLFRENMFILRDKLFDEACEGLIAFDHPAYGRLRRTMNGFIRFGHQLSLWQIISLMILVNKQDIVNDGASEKAWKRVTSDLDPSTKKRLEVYRRQSEILALKHIFSTFPEVVFVLLVAVIFLPVVVLGLLILVIAFVARGINFRSIPSLVWNKIRPRVEGFDSVALTYGS